VRCIDDLLPDAVKSDGKSSAEVDASGEGEVGTSVWCIATMGRLPTYMHTSDQLFVFEVTSCIICRTRDFNIHFRKKRSIADESLKVSRAFILSTKTVVFRLLPEISFK
jgi:hypothetical protein